MFVDFVTPFLFAFHAESFVGIVFHVSFTLVVSFAKFLTIQSLSVNATFIFRDDPC